MSRDYGENRQPVSLSRGPFFVGTSIRAAGPPQPLRVSPCGCRRSDANQLQFVSNHCVHPTIHSPLRDVWRTGDANTLGER